MIPNSRALQSAQELDAADELAVFRDRFHIPTDAHGNPSTYLVGHSLGLQPKTTRECVEEVLDQWQNKGVHGHFDGEYPWMPYHEFLTEPMARLVGGLPDEVVVMNSLTANLHLMMATFYRPTNSRNKILIESHAFPSDHYAVESQIKWHGFDPTDSLLLAMPRQGEELLHEDDIVELIEKQSNEIALILLPGVQYYTGQFLDIQRLAKVANQLEIPIGIDLAHAAGNLPLNLHDWNVDFACWCSYKYLNSGPGSVGGCFVHQRHATNVDLPRFAGWWGHDKQTRFQMKNEFHAIPSAEGWQLSNPPILSLAAIRASLQIFDAAGMSALRIKSLALTGYLEHHLTQRLGQYIEVISPAEPERRGCQLSLKIIGGKRSPHEVFKRIESQGIFADWREPSVIRVAPVPLYNRFADADRLVSALANSLE